MGLGDPCSDCTAQNCAAAYCACYNDPSCGDLVKCLQPCAAGDMNCQQMCFSSNMGAISEASLLDSCAAMSCASQCPGTTALGPCDVCLFEKCAPQMNTCIADPDCASILYCVEMCSPNDCGCELNCYENSCSTQAQNEVMDVDNCLMSSCSGAGC
jgi:hypothetical protein